MPDSILFLYIAFSKDKKAVKLQLSISVKASIGVRYCQGYRNYHSFSQISLIECSAFIFLYKLKVNFLKSLECSTSLTIFKDHGEQTSFGDINNFKLKPRTKVEH